MATHAASSKRRSLRLKKSGLCVWCKENKRVNANHCEMCREKDRESSRKYVRNKKEGVNP